jgi:hypothetical protein
MSIVILDREGNLVEGEGCALLFDTYEAALAFCEADDRRLCRWAETTWQVIPAWDDFDNEAHAMRGRTTCPDNVGQRVRNSGRTTSPL